MIRPENPFDIRPDLRKAASTKTESTTAESVIRPKQLVRFYTAHYNLKDEDNEIAEEEIDAALNKVLILLDQVNDLSKSAK